MAKRIRTLFKRFLASNFRNQWMNGSGLAVYVRKSTRLIEGRMVSCLDIANMQAQRPGRGTGGRFIEDACRLNPSSSRTCRTSAWPAASNEPAGPGCRMIRPCRPASTAGTADEDAPPGPLRGDAES